MPAQHHHAPSRASTAQAQFVFDGLPALAGIGGARPLFSPEQLLDQPRTLADLRRRSS